MIKSSAIPVLDYESLVHLIYPVTVEYYNIEKEKMLNDEQNEELRIDFNKKNNSTQTQKKKRKRTHNMKFINNKKKKKKKKYYKAYVKNGYVYY